MIDYACFCQIKHLHEQQGLSAAQIAATLALDPRTVASWLTQERFRPRKAAQRARKLDPFKGQVVRMLEKYPYSAAQVLQHLREQGFDGGYSLVKAYVRTVRPTRQAAFLKLAFAPGECAQVDWGSFGAVPVGQTSRRLSFFVMVLCYSRMLYVEFTVSQTMEHFLACHQHAFEFFGGVPQKVMVDNLKSAVLQRALGQAPVFNPKYLDFAHHTGFTIVPCNVGKGNEKGRVENGVGYVKKNFLAGLEIADFSALNPAARQWLDTIANVRLHGETRAKPTALWHKEQPSLRPLPPQAETYSRQLEARRLNPHHHVRKIVALSDIYTPEAVSRALEDALVYEAFSSDYIANLLEQRARFTPEASALHLTRRADLLEVRLAQPDLSIYQATLPPEHSNIQEPD